MRTLYHGTSVNNVDSILEKGLLKSVFEGGVYLTDTADSAARWTGFKLSAMGEDKLAVIEVQVDKHKLELGCDHSPMIVTIFEVGESLLHEGDIPSDQIKDVIYYGKQVK